MNATGMGTFESEEGLVGGCAYDAYGVAITDEAPWQGAGLRRSDLRRGRRAEWDKVPYDVRPEAGLLRLRKDLGLFANIRPAICYPALAEASSLNAR
jgi:3-isopropylmalate dehydrogenase